MFVHLSVSVCVSLCVCMPVTVCVHACVPVCAVHVSIESLLDYAFILTSEIRISQWERFSNVFAILLKPVQEQKQFSSNLVGLTAVCKVVDTTVQNFYQKIHLHFQCFSLRHPYVSAQLSFPYCQVGVYNKF